MKMHEVPDRRISITELSQQMDGQGEEVRRIAELEARLGPGAKDVSLKQRDDAATTMQNQFRTAMNSPDRKAEKDGAGTKEQEAELKPEWRSREEELAYEQGPVGHSREEYRSQHRGGDPKPTRKFEERKPTEESVGLFGPPPRDVRGSRKVELMDPV